MPGCHGSFVFHSLILNISHLRQQMEHRRQSAALRKEKRNKEGGERLQLLFWDLRASECHTQTAETDHL